MKYTKILASLLLCSVFSLSSCNDKPTSKVGEIPEGDVSNSATTTEADTPITSTEPAQNAAGVWHYTCPNGDSGGAGSAVPCAVCGATLAHNSAYHGNPTDTSNASSTAPFANNPAAESGQNTAGVWHYICPKGDAGGAGTATACPTCGTTLVHNQAFH
ncbi:hypothetical protein SAMN03097699_0655 [Flavobacteriaceae bacterium MAR_2010_188]|nr:hypothetical protein SAMN03097699_0655 [Flavobacteriaceae bacterium MAR_2010_188]